MRGLFYIIIFKRFFSILRQLVQGLIVVASASLLVGALGCSYNVQKAGSAANSSRTDSGQGSLSADTVISYALVNSYSMSSCQNCHLGTKQPTLDSIETVRANISKVMTSIEANKMPPASAGYSALSDCQKAIMKKWVDLGTPETSTAKVSELPECKIAGPIGSTTPSTPVPEIPLAQMPLNYDTLKVRILQKRCLSCHVPDDPDASDYPFDTYQALTDPNQSGDVWQAPAVKSKVYRDITAADDSDKRMPPVDSKLPRLTNEEVDFIVRWIDAGRPEK